MKQELSALPAGFVAPHVLAGLDEGAPVAVALSGGADSVALLHMLSKHCHAPLYALHVHHGLRGEEADRDAAFCREVADALQVPLTVLYEDVPALARAYGEGLETAARRARYGAFERFLKETGISLLATAHHADDQLETMLQNLLRGSGLRGLCGIPACRALDTGLVVRPLLQVTKADISAYCQAHALSFVHDSTNDTACCPRNRLRAEVLPVLAALWPRGAASAARCAESLSRDEAYLSEQAQNFLQQWGKAPPSAALCALPYPIFARVMQALLPAPPEAVHLHALRTLAEQARPHASLSLPGATVRVQNGCFVVERERAQSNLPYELVLSPGENRLPNGMGVVFLEKRGKNMPQLPENVYKYSTRVDFSSAIMVGSLTVRPRRPGERILSGGKHKLLRKLGCMSRFSLAERARMPLLCDGAGVLAVPFGPLRDGAQKDCDTVAYLFFN